LRFLVVSCLALLLTGVSGAVRAAAAPGSGPGSGYVKYAVVRADQHGEPERLWQVAVRVLGDGSRYRQIFDLNRDRVQPDGGRLSDPAALRPGWVLVLPWDARGDGVLYGMLPTVSPPQQPVTGSNQPPGGATCGTLPTWAAAPVPWAQLRMTPDAAWGRSRGQGTTVAVVDSGVDATVPALAGRVLAGIDATGAGQPADRDCLGHGTAVAAIVAAQPTAGTGVIGMAPEATVLPVRIDPVGAAARPEQAANALRLALSRGAGVILVAAPIDAGDPLVAAALREATTGDAVVVLAAPAPGQSVAAVPAGVLRVGASGPDDAPASLHPAGTVDVLAPGINVVSIGVGGRGAVEGNGADFAAPFVAGLVALLRAAEPGLTAVAAADRVRQTADQTEDPRAGWGVINPGVAVRAVQADRAAAGGAGPGPGGLLVGFLAVVVVAAAVLAALRWRKGAYWRKGARRGGG
jgi:hypothetical protein